MISGRTLFLVILSSAALLSQSVPAMARELRFETVYRVPWYENGWIIGGAVTAVTLGAVAMTAVSVGTGASTATAGAGWLASIVGGGGGGVDSYMAGLSAVGAAVGGNAIVGATILNGFSAGLVGGNLGGGGLLAVIVTLKPGQIGVVFMKGQRGRKKGQRGRREDRYAVEYIVPLMLSDEIGSKLLAKKWVANIREVSKELEKLSLEDTATRQELAKRLQVIPAETKDFLDATTAVAWPALSDLDQENYVAALLVLAQFPGFRTDFVSYTARIPDSVAGDRGRSFVTYLKAVGCLYKKDYVCAERFSRAAMDAEPQALEPILVQAISLNARDRYTQAVGQESLIDQHYGEAHYKSPNDRSSAYILFGDLAIAHRSFRHAVRFYQAAWEATGTFADREHKTYLCAKLALAYKRVGEIETAEQYLAKAHAYAKDSDNPNALLKPIEEIYHM